MCVTDAASWRVDAFQGEVDSARTLAPETAFKLLVREPIAPASAEVRTNTQDAIHGYLDRGLLEIEVRIVPPSIATATR